MRELGSVPTILFGERLLLALDKKLMQFNNGKPLEFQVKINDNGNLVLLGPQIMKPSKTGVTNDNG